MSHICEDSLDGLKIELSARYVKIKRLVPTTIECQDSVFERESVFGCCTECGGIVGHVGSHGHPASPGRDAGPLC